MFALPKSTRPSSKAVLAAIFLTMTGMGSVAQTPEADPTDIRDLAALLLFNGEDGARAYDTSGPIGDDDANWSRKGPGRYAFATARAGVSVHGDKVVDVDAGCIVRVVSRFVWTFEAKPSETLERIEEFDFSERVVADGVLALRNDRPEAVILDMNGGDRFYCVSTRINGVDVQTRRCDSAVRPVVGPGREDSPVMERFRRFSVACRKTKGSP
jgi:hypothetical protein